MTDPSPSHAQRPPLGRRLILLFLLAAAAALGIVLLLRVRPGFPYLALIFLAAALLGLVCGLGTRLLLKRRHWLVRFLSATLALLGGLLLIGLFSAWRYGLSPQYVYALDPAGSIQLITGLLVTLLAARAWRRPVPRVHESVPPPPSQPVMHADPLPQRSRLPRAGKPHLTRPPSGVHVAESRRPAARRKPKPAGSSASRGRTKDAPGPAASRAAQAKKSPVVRPAKSGPRRRARRPEVQFVSTEEHRCPYCLEIVHPRDPRGIVECKICHTLHHADCWAITGTCQVPHLNS
ncbi:MAG: hypothetical protein JXB85_09255 [Anaerolineales bacterium]|nr:hypothetical protein [Anaerolineales bacterium]